MEIKNYSFKELLSVIIDNRGKTCPVSDKGLPLIATNCIKMDSLYPVFERVRYVSKETYENWFRGHPEPEDIIFVCKGSPGRVALAPDPVNFCIAQDMLSIRANKEIVDQKFLFALLRSTETQTKMLNMHVGTLIPHFKKGDFGNLFFDIPIDKKIQKNIGDIYHMYSEKIELNRKMNESLEAMAQALFRSWFVDFDPVLDNFLANNDNNVEALPEPLRKKGAIRLEVAKKNTPEINKLFPNNFVFNEVLEKWIPEGWRDTNIGDDFNVTMGQSPAGSTFNENGEGIAFFQGKTDFGFRFPKNRIYCTSPKRMARKNETLISVRAPVGNANLANSDCSIGRGLCAVIHKSKSISYTYYSILELRKKFDVFEGEGTVFGSINQNDLKSLEVIKATDSVLDLYEKLASKNDKKIEIQENQTLSLTKLRDTLLPQLISGKLEVSEAMLEIKKEIN
jgi:type I restriction enzyme S subunit